METLRLIITRKCNRSCHGCCNNQEQFKDENIETVTLCTFLLVDQVIITGGEPLLFATETIRLAEILKKDGKQVIVYTAFGKNYAAIEKLLEIVDGITLTLHDQSDVDHFRFLNFHLLQYKRWLQDNNKSLRLNVFKGIDLNTVNLSLWKIKDNIEWVEDCPLPENEIIRKIDPLL